MDIRLDASMEEALERVSIWTSEPLARPEDTMPTETNTTTRTPDTDRSDDGIGRPITTPRGSVDDLGSPTRIERNTGGPDDPRDPDFGSYGSGSSRNSSLF